MADRPFLFQVIAVGPSSSLPADEPVFAQAFSAHEARAMIAQIFGSEPGQVELKLRPGLLRGPRDAYIYRLEPGPEPLGERWILYRG